MKTSVAIRKASLPDLPGLCHLYREVHAFHQRALPRVFRRIPGTASFRGLLRDLLADRNTVVFVAEADGRLLGAVHAILRKASRTPLLNPRTLVILENLTVAMATRRRGIGTALCKAVEAWAAARQADEMQLHVWGFNRGAAALYQRLGWRTTGLKMAKPVVNRIAPKRGRPS